MKLHQPCWMKILDMSDGQDCYFEYTNKNVYN